MERDQIHPWWWKLLEISTHTLTWSVTSQQNYINILLIISTHTLTWSVTRGVALHLWEHMEFQLTRSRGAWPQNISILYIVYSISTHTLTWSVTRMNCGNRKVCYFNSHAHVERDRAINRWTQHNTNFNSHAHVERDPKSKNPLPITNISTHTLTWSVTYAYILSYKTTSISTHTLTWSVTILASVYHFGGKYFNSHAHVERDKIKY